MLNKADLHDVAYQEMVLLLNVPIPLTELPKPATFLERPRACICSHSSYPHQDILSKVAHYRGPATR